MSVALHELGSALDASVDTIQWVSTAYLLAMFVSIPLAGWAQSRLGGKRLWLLALTVFLVGSVLCACAWNVESLIAFRAVQGLGGGVMLPLMTTILMQAAHGRSLGRLMAAVSLPAALGPILGPVVGGLILGSLPWEWLFLVNVPLCLAGLLLAVRMLPADEPGRRVPLDVTGLPASRFAMGARGQLRAGWWADLVLFDPARIRDTASFHDPIRAAEGIAAVWVNGQLAYDGRQVVARPGRFIRPEPAPAP